jgi:predicted ribosome quality control (RQC) complex YloA/Tae2 family protein
LGRHFRLGENKIIVGRNEVENKLLLHQKNADDFYFELAEIVGPVTLLQGPKTKTAIRKAAEITAFYSDAKNGDVKVSYGKAALEKYIVVSVPQRVDVEKLRVGNETAKS